MRGFCDKALIIGPLPDNYESKSYEQRARFVKSVKCLVKYLNGIGIKPCVFSTDEVMVSIYPEGVLWVKTLKDSDMFFMSRVNPVYKVSKGLHDVVDNDILDKSFKKYKLEDSLKNNNDSRFYVVDKRENMSCKEYIKKFKAVFIFKQGANSLHKVSPKLGDGKIISIINNSTFVVDTNLSGKSMNPIDLLDFKSANRPMYEWEV